MGRTLTSKQEKFLAVLFEEARGIPARATEIADLTKKFIATRGPQAAFSLLDVMQNPTDLGNKEKMAAAKDLLDRAGFVKTDKVEVKSDSPLFILPPKDIEYYED